jgi:hypothetical protein
MHGRQAARWLPVILVAGLAVESCAMTPEQAARVGCVTGTMLGVAAKNFGAQYLGDAATLVSLFTGSDLHVDMRHQRVGCAPSGGGEAPARVQIVGYLEDDPVFGGLPEDALYDFDVVTQDEPGFVPYPSYAGGYDGYADAGDGGFPGDPGYAPDRRPGLPGGTGSGYADESAPWDDPYAPYEEGTTPSDPYLPYDDPDTMGDFPGGDPDDPYGDGYPYDGAAGDPYDPGYGDPFDWPEEANVLPPGGTGPATPPAIPPGRVLPGGVVRPIDMAPEKPKRRPRPGPGTPTEAPTTVSPSPPLRPPSSALPGRPRQEAPSPGFTGVGRLPAGDPVGRLRTRGAALEVAMVHRRVGSEDLAPMADGALLRRGLGDAFQVVVRPAQATHLYVYVVDATGWIQRIHPEPALGLANPIPAGHAVVMPPHGLFGLDEVEGVHEVWFLASAEPRPDVEAVLAAHSLERPRPMPELRDRSGAPVFERMVHPSTFTRGITLVATGGAVALGAADGTPTPVPSELLFAGEGAQEVAFVRWFVSE